MHFQFLEGLFDKLTELKELDVEIAGCLKQPRQAGELGDLHEEYLREKQTLNKEAIKQQRALIQLYLDLHK